MALHYNAFISYRHQPEDIRVATEIHRLLERFPIPRALKKQGKTIRRLFRDKDELPITSKLSDDISAALANSDYLIVICSVHTRESLWIQREIETFLQTHSRDRVLTVLVNGEPYDVIPEILLYETITDPETGEEKKVPLEPLSCDWRLPRRQARREELPRLAAALLHCSYDELRQRQKQYRMQKLLIFGSIALAASLCLAAYFLYTSITIRNANIQIQANLDRSLKNQSQHLASAAEERLEAGDRLTALTLLLEALPEQEGERPYVAQAEKVLADTLGVYASSRTLHAKGVIVPSYSAQIYDFAVSADKSSLFVLDARNHLTVWDADSLLQLADVPLSGQATDFAGVTPAGDVLVPIPLSREDSLCCYGRDGTLRWRVAGCRDTALLGEDKLLVLAADSRNDRYLHIIDLNSGEDLQKPLLLSTVDGEETALSFLQDSFEVGMPLLLQYMGKEDSVCLVDAASGARSTVFFSEDYIYKAATLSDGKLLFMISDGSGWMNGRISQTITTSPGRSDIYCYDPTGSSLLWQSEIVSYQYAGTGNFCDIPGSDAIFCQSGNTLQLLDRNSGSLLARCDAPSGVIEILDVDAQTVTGVLQNGYVFFYAMADNVCESLDYRLETDLLKTAFRGNIYTMQMNSNRVCVYHFTAPDYAWTDGSEEYLNLSQGFCRKDDMLAFRDGMELRLYDLAQQTLLWQIDRGYLKLLGFSADGETLWAAENCHLLSALDPKSGERKDYRCPESINDSFLTKYGTLLPAEGAFWFLAANEQEELLLIRWQPETDELQSWPLFSAAWGDDRAEDAHILGIYSTKAWLLSGSGELLLLSLESGKVSALAEGFSFPAFARRDSDGSIAIARESEVLLYSAEGEHLQRFTLPDGEFAAGLCLWQEELLALSSTGYVFRFAADGQLLSTTTGLTVSGSMGSSALSQWLTDQDIRWHFTGDNKLILQAFSIVNIIDCESWEVCGSLEGCVLYHERDDYFLLNPYYTLSACIRQSLDSLQALAREQLGSFRLSPEEQKSYGLSE